MKLTGQGYPKNRTSESIKKLENVSLVWEKENPMNDQAIAVHFNDKRIGYIGEKEDFFNSCDRSKLPMDAVVETVSYAQKEGYKSFKEGELVSMIIKEPTPPLPFLFEPSDIVRDDKGRYTKDGKKFISITTLLNNDFTGGAAYAIALATGEEARKGPTFQKYLDGMKRVTHRGSVSHDITECFFRFWGDDLKVPSKEFLEKGAIIKSGYRTEYDSRMSSDEWMTVEEKNHLIHCLKTFKKKFKAEFISAEEVVFDTTIEVAGRYDAIMRVKPTAKSDWITVLIDWKSGNYSEKQGLQGAFNAKNVDVDIDEVWIVSFNYNKLGKVDKYGKKTIPTQGFSNKRIKNIDEHYEKLVAFKKYKDILL